MHTTHVWDLCHLAGTQTASNIPYNIQRPDNSFDRFENLSSSEKAQPKSGITVSSLICFIAIATIYWGDVLFLRSSVLARYRKSNAFCSNQLEAKNVSNCMWMRNVYMIQIYLIHYSIDSFVFLLNRWYWLWNVGFQESVVCLPFAWSSTKLRRRIDHLCISFPLSFLRVLEWEMHRAAFFNKKIPSMENWIKCTSSFFRHLLSIRTHPHSTAPSISCACAQRPE